MTKILITGSAGFIGFNFSRDLLNKKGYKIIGLDNFNDYYDINLKKRRNKILKKFKNYKFFKIDINNKVKLVGSTINRNKIYYRKIKNDHIQSMSSSLFCLIAPAFLTSFLHLFSY